VKSLDERPPDKLWNGSDRDHVLAYRTLEDHCTFTTSSGENPEAQFDGCQDNSCLLRPRVFGIFCKFPDDPRCCVATCSGVRLARMKRSLEQSCSRDCLRNGVHAIERVRELPRLCGTHSIFVS
jgi:hypothetical protein